jgi:hypothetical protein
MLFAISLLVYAMGGLGTSVAVLNRQLAIPSRKKKVVVVVGMWDS